MDHQYFDQLIVKMAERWPQVFKGEESSNHLTWQIRDPSRALKSNEGHKDSSSMCEAIIDAIQKLGQSDVESARKLIMPIIEDVNLFNLLRCLALWIAFKHLGVNSNPTSAIWRSPAEADYFYNTILPALNRGDDTDLSTSVVSSSKILTPGETSQALPNDERPLPETPDESPPTCLSLLATTVRIDDVPLQELRFSIENPQASWAQSSDAINACDVKMKGALQIPVEDSQTTHTPEDRVLLGSVEVPDSDLSKTSSAFLEASNTSNANSNHESAARPQQRVEPIKTLLHRSSTLPLAENPRRKFDEWMSLGHTIDECRRLRARIDGTRIAICRGYFEEYRQDEAVLNSCRNMFVMMDAGWEQEALIEGHMKLADEHRALIFLGGGDRSDRMHAQRQMWRLQDVLRVYGELAPQGVGLWREW